MVMPLLFLIPLFLPLWQNSTCSRALWRESEHAGRKQYQGGLVGSPEERWLPQSSLPSMKTRTASPELEVAVAGSLIQRTHKP